MLLLWNFFVTVNSCKKKVNIQRLFNRARYRDGPLRCEDEGVKGRHPITEGVGDLNSIEKEYLTSPSSSIMWQFSRHINHKRNLYFLSGKKEVQNSVFWWVMEWAKWSDQLGLLFSMINWIHDDTTDKTNYHGLITFSHNFSSRVGDSHLGKKKMKKIDEIMTFFSLSPSYFFRLESYGVVCYIPSPIEGALIPKNAPVSFSLNHKV